MKVTFAEWGNYTIAFRVLFEKLGFDVIPSQKTNPKSIEEGAKLSPDLFCFPLKVNIGNYLPALRKGADTIFMWESIGGSCRMRYYWMVQEKILKEAGFDVGVINFNSRNLFSRIKSIKKDNNISYWQIIKTAFLFFKEIKFIESIERAACYLRPREKNRGQTDQVLLSAFDNLEKINNTKELASLQKSTQAELAKIEIDKNKETLKIGVIGEIYTVVDGAVNFGLEKKLGEMEIEAHRKLSMTHYLLESLLPWREKQLQRRVAPYLKSTVGGHGRQGIEEMLEFTKKNFDGVIQLLPFGCMPEITVRPILQEISRKNNLPFLSVSLDEQTAETGLQTRLEAFADLLWSRRKNKKFNHQVS